MRRLYTPHQAVVTARISSSSLLYLSSNYSNYVVVCGGAAVTHPAVAEQCCTTTSHRKNDDHPRCSTSTTSSSHHVVARTRMMMMPMSRRCIAGGCGAWRTTTTSHHGHPYVVQPLHDFIAYTSSMRCYGSSTNNKSTTTTTTTSTTTTQAPGGGATTPAPTTPPTTDSADQVNMWRVIRSVLSHLWPKNQWRLRALVVGSVSMMLIAKATRLAVPFWFRSVIDTLAPTTAAAAAGGVTTAGGAVIGPITLGIFALVAAYGLTRLTASLTDEIKGAIFAPVGAHATTQVSTELFRKLLHLDLKFHLNRQTGVLSKDMDRGSRAFWSLSYAILFMVVPTAFEMSLVCGALQTQAGTGFVVTAVVAVVLYIYWTYAITQWRAKYRDAYNAQESRVGGLTVDALLNYETIKYFGREDYEDERIGAEIRTTNKTLAKLDQSMAVLNFGQQAIFAIAATSSLYFSATAVVAGTMTVGDLVLVDALLLQLYSPLSWLGMLYRELQSSSQNMKAMLKLMDASTTVSDPASPRRLAAPQQASSQVTNGADEAPNMTTVNQQQEEQSFVFGNGTIELRGVSFAYDESFGRGGAAVEAAGVAEGAQSGSNGGGVPAAAPVVAPPVARRGGVLQNVSLTIPGGSCVAFVGPSGCGKSTIFRLLFRFFDPASGSVLIDGQDLRSVPMASFRKHIGVIPQDTMLFHDTVINNIRYGDLTASDDMCIAAAKAANVHESILRMSEGYQTLVGERGAKLSGGERQRVSIARALLYNPPILLTDEATSALDTRTETSVMRTLRPNSSSSRSGGDDSDEERDQTAAATAILPKRSSRTIVMIAHRLSTIRDADCIFVLNGSGMLSEQGTHEELLALPNGIYSGLWSQQQKDNVQQADG